MKIVNRSVQGIQDALEIAAKRGEKVWIARKDGGMGIQVVAARAQREPGDHYFQKDRVEVQTDSGTWVQVSRKHFFWRMPGEQAVLSGPMSAEEFADAARSVLAGFLNATCAPRPTYDRVMRRFNERVTQVYRIRFGEPLPEGPIPGLDGDITDPARLKEAVADFERRAALAKEAALFPPEGRTYECVKPIGGPEIRVLTSESGAPPEPGKKLYAQVRMPIKVLGKDPLTLDRVVAELVEVQRRAAALGKTEITVTLGGSCLWLWEPAE